MLITMFGNIEQTRGVGTGPDGVGWEARRIPVVLKHGNYQH